MTALEIERHPLGPRLRLCGQRVHHGAAGLLAVAIAPRLLGGRSRLDALALGCLGALAMADDRHDVRAWLRPGPQR